jgi:chromosome segregation ATPase
MKIMETMSADLFLLKKKLRDIEQKINEVEGGLRLMRKRILSLSRTLGELMVQKEETKKEIEELEQKERR